MNDADLEISLREIVLHQSHEGAALLMSSVLVPLAEAGKLGEPEVFGKPLDPYLSRWSLVPKALFLHFFHRGDGTQDFHNHPWQGAALILRGGYVEERVHCPAIGRRPSIVTRAFRPGDVSLIVPNTFHRVDLLDPAQGSWSLMVVAEKVQSWGFMDRETGAFTQHAEHEDH